MSPSQKNITITALYLIPNIFSTSFYNYACFQFLQFDRHAIMTILRKGSFRTSPQENLHNNHLYDGSENYLSISRSYSVDFQCGYAMHYYPFDIQKCTMDLVLGVCIIYDKNN